MSANVPDLQPDTDDILQVEAGPEPAVLVDVQGPVRNQPLPTKAGASFTRTGVPVVNAANPTALQVLRADHRRAVAFITSFDQDMFIGFSRSTATDTSRMTRWPVGTPYPCSATTDIFVAAVTGVAAISVSTELWATGGE